MGITSSWTWLGLTFLATVSLLGALVANSFNVDSNRKHPKEANAPGDQQQQNYGIAVAFLGNSMQYFNDCPRLLQQMLETTHQRVHQNSCLRGGASLTTLWENGNGMETKFSTQPALLQDKVSYDTGAPNVTALLQETNWDFVVLNDFTQHPARDNTRNETIRILTRTYAPLFKDAVPVIIQTMAYKKKSMRGTKDLGSLDEFTNHLAAGVQMYQEKLGAVTKKPCRVAPVGEAVRWLYHNDHSLWGKLYSWDDFHPSPHGTWLQACILYCVITQQKPPMYDPMWWEQSRYMQPPNEKPLPLPSNKEARELRNVACLVCGIPEQAGARCEF